MAQRFEQPSHRLAKRLIVIDDRDQRSMRHSGL
jgi:hypothetical protein